jgi:hypothetical protein
MRAQIAIAAGAGLAALALSVAGGVAAAPPGAGYFNCGAANSIAGHTWAIHTMAVGCRAAKRVVKDLANKTVPRGGQSRTIGVFRGAYAGMRCVGGLPAQKPKSLACARQNGAGLLNAVRLR